LLGRDEIGTLVSRSAQRASDPKERSHVKPYSAKSLSLGPTAYASLALLLLLPACYHGTQSRQAGTPATASSWREVRPPSTGYQVSMPGNPSIKTEEMTDFDGTRMVATIGRYEHRGKALYGFAVIYSENGHAPDPTERASRARRSEEGDAEEVVVSRRAYVHEGFPTIDIVTEDATNGVMFFSRTSVGRSRVFYSYVGIRSRDRAQMQPVVDYFLGSIRLHPSEAQSPVGDGRLVASEWQYVYPPEGAFAVMMPGAPRYVKTEIPGEDDPIDVHAYGVQSEDRQHVFDVRVVDYEARPTEEQIAEARARLIPAGYRLREERPVERQGYPGHELLIESDGSFVRVQLYFTNARLYEVKVRVPRDYEQRSEPAQRRFFDSFRIL